MHHRELKIPGHLLQQVEFGVDLPYARHNLPQFILVESALLLNPLKPGKPFGERRQGAVTKQQHVHHVVNHQSD